jgi:hypothetical protein
VDASLYASQEILSDRGLDEVDVNELGNVELTYANHDSTVPKRRSSVSCARCTAGMLSNIHRSFIAEKYVDRGRPVLFVTKHGWMLVCTIIFKCRITLQISKPFFSFCENSRLCFDAFVIYLMLKIGYCSLCPRVIPDDCFADWFPRLSTPYDRGFTLVSYSLEK